MPEDVAQLSLANSIGSNILAKVKRESTAGKHGLVPNYLISGLASLGCSPQEISTLTKIPQDKLPKDLIAQGKAKLQHALRRAQIKAALKGNPAMLIWLGKALLNQRDQPETANNQHTNIVVTSDLLKNLQSSYHNTIQDFRNSRALIDSPHDNPVANHHDSLSNHFNPHKQPALPAVFEASSSVASDTLTQDTESESEVERDVAHTQCDDTQPIATQHSSEQEQGSVTPITQPHPPLPAPPTRTPTPTPKRPQSLLSEDFEDASVCAKKAQPKRLTSRGLGNLKKGQKATRQPKVTKWAQYAVGQTAERWSDSLKKLKEPRGGSRKGKVSEGET